MIKIDVNNAVGALISSRELANLAVLSAKVCPRIKGRVEINIIDDREMKKLNYTWRGLRRTTDVLSFAWQEEKKLKSECLGQIFVSYPRAVKQAAELGVKPQKEFYRLVTHGLLHLGGMDHQTRAGAKEMFSREDKILEKFLSL